MAVAEGHGIQTVKALSHGPDVGQKGGDAPVSYSIRKPSVSIQQTEPVLSRETIRWGFVFDHGGDLKAHGRLPAVDAAHGQYLAVHAAGHLRGQK